MRLSPEPQDMVLHRALVRFLQMCTDRRQPVRLAIVVRFLPFGPLLRLKTPRLRWFLTGTLRNWNPRPACGTAFRSVCISISVCVFVRVSCPTEPDRPTETNKRTLSVRAASSAKRCEHDVIPENREQVNEKLSHSIIALASRINEFHIIHLKRMKFYVARVAASPPDCYF